MCDDQRDVIISAFFFVKENGWTVSATSQAWGQRSWNLKHWNKYDRSLSPNLRCICDSSLIKWATNRTNLTFAFGVWWYLGGPSPKSPSPMRFLWDLGQWLDELRRNAYKKKSWEIKWDLQLRTSVCLKNAARNTGWLNARQFLANGFLQQNW